MEITLILVFLLGIVSSLLAGIAGSGGSFIAVPGLLMIGLPAQIAIAVRRFSGLGEEVSTMIPFIRAGLINWKLSLKLAVITIIATVIGANILINIDEALTHKLVGIAMLIALPFLLINGFGTEKKKPGKFKKYLGYGLYFLADIAESFISVVGGAFTAITLVGMMGMTYLEASGAKKLSGLVMAITGSIIFAYHGLINYEYGIVLMLGMIIGGFVGARIAINQGSKFVRIVFSVLVLALAIKILFF